MSTLVPCASGARVAGKASDAPLRILNYSEAHTVVLYDVVHNVTVCAESVVINVFTTARHLRGAQTHRFDNYYQLRKRPL
jgi:hypothetical protein